MVHPIPKAVAARKVVLENASKAALELFRLTRDSCKWFYLQHMFNTLTDTPADSCTTTLSLLITLASQRKYSSAR